MRITHPKLVSASLRDVPLPRVGFVSRFATALVSPLDGTSAIRTCSHAPAFFPNPSLSQVLRPTHKPSLMSQALRKPFLSSPQTPAASLGLGTFSRTHPGSCMSSRRHPVRNGTSASPNIQGSPRQGLLIHERLLLLPGTSFHILNHLENSRLAFTCQLRHCFSCEVPADVSR